MIYNTFVYFPIILFKPKNFHSRNSRHGMIDIHEFYDFNLTELADGKIFDVLTGIEHQSKSGLGTVIKFYSA